MNKKDFSISKDHTYCCVPQCKSRGYLNPELSFHKFPNPQSTFIRRESNKIQRVNRRLEWKRVLRIGKEISKRMVVCSRHFQESDYILAPHLSQRPRLNKSAVPTCNLPKTLPYNEEKEKKNELLAHNRELRCKEIQNGMPASCSAFGCTNRARSDDCIKRKVSFFAFPLKNKLLLEQWLLKMRRKHFIPSVSSKICSDHFEEECFTCQNFTNVRYLKKDAVPTIFSFKEQETSKKYMEYEFGNMGEYQHNKKHKIAVSSLENYDFQQVDSASSLASADDLEEQFSHSLKKMRSTSTFSNDDSDDCAFNKVSEGRSNQMAMSTAKNLIDIAERLTVPPSESNREDIFGKFVASEMKVLTENPLLYLQTKQAILEILTSAHFELINPEEQDD